MRDWAALNAMRTCCVIARWTGPNAIIPAALIPSQNRGGAARIPEAGLFETRRWFSGVRLFPPWSNAVRQQLPPNPTGRSRKCRANRTAPAQVLEFPTHLQTRALSSRIIRCHNHLQAAARRKSRRGRASAASRPVDDRRGDTVLYWNSSSDRLQDQRPDMARRS